MNIASLLKQRSHIADQSLHDFANEVGQSDPVVVVGGDTQSTVGGTADPTARMVRAPSGIVKFQSDEMTVCVRAGTTVAELHATLAEQGQRTVLPDGSGLVGSPESTVGGAIAVGRPSVDRLKDGHIRDAVLQLRYVAANGALVTAGGPTVKNVSGFDLCRIMVGALGTLGCLAEAILRTRPCHAHQQWVKLNDINPKIVHQQTKTATAILWDGTTVWAHLVGHQVDVADDLARLPTATESEPPELPPHRWSRRPQDIYNLTNPIGSFIAEVGVGVIHSDHLDPTPAQMPPTLAALNRRVRDLFDPTRRFNPGRSVEQK